MSELFAFCLNSRRWVLFMDARGRYPKTCPNKGRCYDSNCGYFEEREPNKYLMNQLRKIQVPFD